LREASLQWAQADEALRTSNLELDTGLLVVGFFKARIAYEQGRFEESRVRVEPILAVLLRGDSWLDLLATVTRFFAFSAFWEHGLAQALATFDLCALTLSRRHGPRDEALQLLRIRLLQSARRHAEAETLLQEYDLNPAPHRSAHVDIEEGLIRLRHLIWQSASNPAAMKLARSLAARPELELRQRIAVLLLQANLAHRGGDTGGTRRHLGAALRHAQSESLLGVLVEDSQFLERLLPEFIANPGAGNDRLAAFAQQVLRLLRTLPSLPAHSKALLGVSRQEHRVLSYLNDGYTNKEIARALALSESTVKFHLRNLFRKLGAASRGALKEAARQRNLVT
jgi:LuxR family maltose regulon positive regulatory protein